MIHLRCPKCNKSLKVADAFAGKTGKCPGCGKLCTIPAEPNESDAPHDSDDLVIFAGQQIARDVTTNPIAVVGVILALIALAFCWSPESRWIALPGGLFGMGLGYFASGIAAKRHGVGGVLARTAMVAGMLAVCISTPRAASAIQRAFKSSPMPQPVMQPDSALRLVPAVNEAPVPLLPDDSATVAPSPPPVKADGDVQVRGYYRKDGTYVRPHTRSRPSK